MLVSTRWLLRPNPTRLIADNLKRAGWSWGCVSTVDSNGRTIWIVDAHRDNGKRFVVRADEKLTAFLELESMTKCKRQTGGPTARLPGGAGSIAGLGLRRNQLSHTCTPLGLPATVGYIVIGNEGIVVGDHREAALRSQDIRMSAEHGGSPRSSNIASTVGEGLFGQKSLTASRPHQPIGFCRRTHIGANEIESPHRAKLGIRSGNHCNEKFQSNPCVIRDSGVQLAGRCVTPAKRKAFRCACGGKVECVRFSGTAADCEVKTHHA